MTFTEVIRNRVALRNHRLHGRFSSKAEYLLDSIQNEH